MDLIIKFAEWLLILVAIQNLVVEICEAMIVREQD